MEAKNYTGTVPGQQDGKEIDAESVAELNSVSEAKELFRMARERLLDVNGWADLTKGNLSRFQLTDGEGKEASGYARRGWHFRIDLPAPGTDAGRGFDWVKVEEIIESTSEETESIGLRVKPTSDPGSESEETAHFYSSLSTSTFTITREGSKVTAGIYDRNLKINKDAKKVTDQLRNVLVGAAGMVAFSKIQWKLLADALLGNPEV